MKEIIENHKKLVELTEKIKEMLGAFRSTREQPKTPTTMKHLLTAIACFFALSMSAQAPNPDWNPDFNADEIIGATDLLGLLSAFEMNFSHQTIL